METFARVTSSVKEGSKKLSPPYTKIKECPKQDQQCRTIQRQQENPQQRNFNRNGETLRKLILEDSLLPESICPINPLTSLSKSKVFFMTGVTGTLGPYILLEILRSYSHIEKIYCLMRKSSNPAQRLQEALEMENVDLSKVYIIIGDLSVENFSLEKEEWDKLSAEVDAVIHVAVLSNHVELYGPHVRSRVNVFAMRSILEFCCDVKTKYLFHASSLVAVSSTDRDGRLSQEWPGEDEIEGVTALAYPVSKVICDKLLHQAVKRGLPTKSFRFGALQGDSQTGRFKHENNHFILRFLCFMQLGAMPCLPFPAIFLPIDISANVALKIFFYGKDTFHSDIYNLCHPASPSEQEFTKLAEEFGYKVDIVEYSEFLQRFNNAGKCSLLYPFRKLYESEKNYNSFMKDPKLLTGWRSNPDGFINLDKVVRIIPDFEKNLETTWDYLRRDLCYARDTGLFEKLMSSNLDESHPVK